MAKRLPKTVYVFGFAVPVIHSKRRPRWAPKDAVYGCLDYNGGHHRIWVSDMGDFCFDRQTLIHELAHLAFWVKGLGFSTPLQEEKYVSAVEAMVDDMLSRNPELVALYEED